MSYLSVLLKKSFWLLLLLTSSVTFAQLPTAALLPVGAKSPDAAILEKFGNIPVSYSTGTPNITIPIYQIKIGEISLPVSLDYHNGGVRVNDIPSSVGSGWALNAGGIVSRNMIGRPDELGGYLSAPSETAIYNDPPKYYQYLFNTGGTSDFEPDMFSYTVGEQSGKFELNKDGSIFQIPLSDNVIQFVNTTSFRVTDNKGVVYIFDLPETINLYNSIPVYTSSWRLSKIIDQNQRDTVFLSYDLGSGSEYSHDDIATFTNTPSCSTDFWSSSSSQLSNTTGDISHPTEYFLNSITWRGGKIVFQNVTDRKDRDSEKRLSEADLYSKTNGNYLEIKRFVLSQSYFYYNSTGGMPYPYSGSDERNYRLKLDSVEIYPGQGSGSPEKYRMTYNPTLMASRESTGQDMWGFNNGQFSNTSLLPIEQVQDYTGKIYTVGTANRNPDSNYMQACSLQAIQYPTGGKSVFVMEPHQYSNPLTTMTSHTFSCATISGSGGGIYSTTFSLPAGNLYSNINYTLSFSNYNYSISIPAPSITVYDQTSGQTTILTSPNNGSKAYTSGQVYLNQNSGQSLILVLGHVYTMTANVYNNTNSSGVVLASLDINWQSNDGNPIQFGGGLRVKTVTNYDLNGNFINEDLYKYGSLDESGVGQLMTYPYFLGISSSFTWNIAFCRSLNGFEQAVGAPISYTYHSNTLSSITEIGGSPVLYPTVAKYQVSYSGIPNGKTIYSYTVAPDTVAGYTNFGPFTITNDWKCNTLSDELTLKTYDGGRTFLPLTDKSYGYGLDRQTNKLQLKITENFNNVSGNIVADSDMVTAEVDPNYSAPYFSFYKYTYPSGILRLHTTTTTTYSDNALNVVDLENHFYDDTTHLLPTRIQIFSSKGDTLTTVMKYPHDFAASGNVYSTMLSRNITAPVIQVQNMKNSTQESLIIDNFADWYRNGAILVPMSVNEQIARNPIETRINFNKYDLYGNIIQQQKTNGAFESYIWDYNKLYPVAAATNADSLSIAYTSFEADGSGNWLIGSTSRNSTGFSGALSYPLSNSNTLSKNGLSASKTYVVSYWTTNSSPLSVTGTVAGYPIKGSTINGWTYYEHQVTGQTTVTLNGTGNVDEVRLYPKDAQMNTYTYNPLIGISSMVNEKNQVTYYEYDSFQRLLNIKDKDGNVIKHYSYHYQGQ